MSIAKVKFSGSMDEMLFKQIQRMSEKEQRSFNSMLSIVVERGLGVVDLPLNARVKGVPTNSEGDE